MRRILLIVIVGLAAWVGGHRWIIRHDLSLAVDATDAGPKWALEWGHGSGHWNGIWVDFQASTDGATMLHLRPSGKRAGAKEGTFEFWLYRIRAAANAAFESDVRRLLKAADPKQVEGRWIPFEQSPAITYADNHPGRLSISVPYGGVTLDVARTPDGGEVEFDYGGTVRRMNLYAPSIEHVSVELQSPASARSQARIERRLPTYGATRLRLRWEDSPSARVSVPHAEIMTHVFGVSIARRELTSPKINGGTLSNGSAAGAAFAATDAQGDIEWSVDPRIGLFGHLIGAAGCVLLVTGLYCAGAAILWLLRAAESGERFVTLAALAAVIALHAAMTAWTPLLLAPDSTDYFRHADTLARTGGTDQFDFWHPPGYSFFVAPFMLTFDRFGVALHWAQAAAGVAVAVLSWWMARRWMPHPWPLLVLVLVGCDPIVLTYEHWALTEILAALLLMSACALAMRGRVASPPSQVTIVTAVAIGALCAAAAYVRANLQLLFGLVPLLFIAAHLRKPNRIGVAACAVCIGVVAVACLAPWLIRNNHKFGRPELAIGRGFTRALSGYNSRIIDPNQSSLFAYDHWKSVQRQISNGLGDFGYLTEIQKAQGLQMPNEQRAAIKANAQCEVVVRESLARDPWGTLGAMGMAFTTQLGLWTRYDHPTANENVHWSGPLRGQPIAETTNWPVTFENDPSLAPLIARTKSDVTFLRGSRPGEMFNELFMGYRAVRPLIVLASLIAIILAVRRRNWPAAVLGGTIVVHAVLLSTLLFSALDRYCVPFIGLTDLLAVYAVFSITSGAPRFKAASPDRPPSHTHPAA